MSDNLSKKAKVIKNEPKHFNKDEGIIFNHNEEFDLGIGQFEPEIKEIIVEEITHILRKRLYTFLVSKILVSLVRNTYNI
jgi:hypothetical protein